MSRFPAIFLAALLTGLIFMPGCADDPQNFMPAQGQTWPAGKVDALLPDQNGQVQHQEMAFADALKIEDKTLVLDFWAQWCGPCRMLAPELEDLAADRPDIVVLKINVDENRELANQFQVNSIPAVHLVKDGQWVKRFVGFRDSSSMSDFIPEAE